MKQGINKQLDLNIIKSFTTITKKYINLQNLCYAVMTVDEIYVPITASVYTTDSIPLTFEVYDKSKLPKYSSLIKFFEGINAFIKSNYMSQISLDPIYSLLVPGTALEYNGVIECVKTTKGIPFYCTDITNLPVKQIKYDYIEINKLILSRSQGTIDSREKLLGHALYTNYIYHKK